MNNYIDYLDIKDLITNENKIGSGKEVNVYLYGKKVIKIFHNDRKSPLKRISDNGLIKLSNMELNFFNKPIEIIVDNGEIVGYTEKYLEEQENNYDYIDFEGIKKDIYTLSQNGFCLNDIFYNYIFSCNKMYFTDLTSYEYIDAQVEFLKNKFYEKNIKLINQFFAGLIEFNAFRKGESNEYTKLYLANEFCNNYLSDIYYGDFKKNTNNKTL